MITPAERQRLSQMLDAIFDYIVKKLKQDPSMQESLRELNENYDHLDEIRQTEAVLNKELHQFFDQGDIFSCFSALNVTTPIWRGVIRPNQFHDCFRLFSWTWVRGSIEEKTPNMPDLPWGNFLQLVHDWVDAMHEDPRVARILELESQLTGCPVETDPTAIVRNDPCLAVFQW